MAVRVAPVIRVFGPPKRSGRGVVVKRLRSEIERGHRRMVLHGIGPDAFEVAFEACVDVSRTHGLALTDRTGVTRQWHRIVRQTDRTTTRAAMLGAPWKLELLTAPFHFPVELSDDAPDRIEVTEGESVMEIGPGRCYFLGPQAFIADDAS